MKLSYLRYESIKRDVVNTYREYNINEIPINPFTLGKRMGIDFIKYSDMDEKDVTLIEEIQPDGFISSDRTKIFYNDRKHPNKIRFTILHEIGHKIRGHMEYSQLAETEANWFAAYGIAPPPLIDLFNISEYTDIADVFETTLDCAMHAMERYVSWKKSSNKDIDYIKDLLELFKKYR